MIVEITSAADFLVKLLKVKQLNNNYLPDETQLAMFKGSLSALLRNRYKEHWFPDHPNRGSGYRCIRINSKMDPVIAQAAAAVGLPVTYLQKLFPFELTLWIDPEEVSYRIGENGSICVLYEKKNAMQEPVALPRESPELYLDPRQEQYEIMQDVDVHC